jgi:hypothetical protein
VPSQALCVLRGQNPLGVGLLCPVHSPVSVPSQALCVLRGERSGGSKAPSRSGFSAFSGFVCSARRPGKQRTQKSPPDQGGRSSFQCLLRLCVFCEAEEARSFLLNNGFVSVPSQALCVLRGREVWPLPGVPRASVSVPSQALCVLRDGGGALGVGGSGRFQCLLRLCVFCEASSTSGRRLMPLFHTKTFQCLLRLCVFCEAKKPRRSGCGEISFQCLLRLCVFCE